MSFPLSFDEVANSKEVMSLVIVCGSIVSNRQR